MITSFLAASLALFNLSVVSAICFVIRLSGNALNVGLQIIGVNIGGRAKEKKRKRKEKKRKEKKEKKRKEKKRKEKEKRNEMK